MKNKPSCGGVNYAFVYIPREGEGGRGEDGEVRGKKGEEEEGKIREEGEERTKERKTKKKEIE